MTPTFWTWATDHWWLAFWLMLWTIVAIASVSTAIFFVLPNRLIRSANIRARGWPPPHLDADGDFRPDVESEDRRRDAAE